MAEKITYSGTASVTDGPTLGFTRSLQVGAYEKLSVDVAKGASSAALPVGLAGSTLRLLLIRSSKYDPKLTFSNDGGTTTHAVNEPIVLAGSGVLELLGAGAVNLTFKNGTTDPVQIEILVARDMP